MSRRSVYVLGLIALALAGFVVFVDRGSVATSEVEARAGRMLPRFVRERLSRIELDRDEERVVLERDVDAAPGTDVWRMSAPVRAPAAEEHVSALLGVLDWATARREVGAYADLDPATRAELGLAEPALVARFAIGSESLTLALGGEDPTGVGRYLRVEDETGARVYVVGRDVAEALDHGADYFRTPRLFPEGVLLTERIVGSGLDLRREDARWWLDTGPDARSDSANASTLAASARVEELLHAINGLEAEFYLAPDAPEMRGAGAAFELSAGDGARTTLSLGEACAGGPSEGERTREVVVTRGDAAVRACVAAAALAPLERAPTEYREARMLSAPLGDIRAIALGAEDFVDGEGDAGGLRLVAREGGWELAGGDRPEAVDADAVRAWYESLLAIEAVTLVEAPAVEVAAVEATAVESTAVEATAVEATAVEATAVEATAVEATAVEAPAVEVAAVVQRVELTVAGAARVLGFVVFPERSAAGELRVRRYAGAGENRRWDALELRLAPAAAEGLARLLAPAGLRLRLRPRTLVQEVPPSAFTLVRRSSRGGRSEERVETLRRAGAGWVMDEPALPGSASAETVSAQLGSLQAERWIAPAPLPEHALGRLEVRFGEHRLRIGAPVPGELGSFASLDDDPAVFMLDRGLVETLELPLVSPTLAATAPPLVHAVRRSGGVTGLALVMIARGEGWVDAAGAPVAEERVDRVLRALGDVRAYRFDGWGPPRPEAGLGVADAPVRLVVERVAEASPPRRYELLLGANDGEGGVYARFPAAELNFRIAEHVADELRAR